jgi:uncharacterized protein involved in outer membrane biogenesis/vacuolar-type H+-ATPase subunit H
MKILIKVVIVVFVLLLAALILIPVIFKDDVVQIVSREVNENLDARVEFGDFSMSLLSNFPDFSFSIEQAHVIGINDFEGDTLVSIGALDLTIDLESIVLDLQARMLRDGTANWDIAKESGKEELKEEKTDVETSVDLPYAISLKKLKVNYSNVLYVNEQDDIRVDLRDLNFSLSGDFAKGFTTLKTGAAIGAATLEMGTIKYLNKTEVVFSADIDADLTKAEYTLKDNELRLNQLLLEWNGSIVMPESGPDLNIRFSAKQTEVKNILSLIPVVYTRDFEHIQAAGKLALDGYVNGSYQEDQLPAFGVKLTVEDGRFKYPDLPKSADNIGVMLNVTNPGGDIDKTLIAIHKFHVEIAENPVDARLVIKTPVSDPEIHCLVEGKVDLNSIGDVIPLEEGEKITGLITSNIKVSGRVSAIEKEEYDKFQAVGGLTIKGMQYRSSDFPGGITIQNAVLRFSPRYVDLTSLECKIGKSDIKASGKVENFIQYAMMDDAVLEGRAELNSRYLDLNDFMTDKGEEETSAAADTVPLSAIEVPGNVDLEITSTFGKIVYGDITMSNVKGKLKVKDRVLTMEKLEMDLLGGRTTLEGSYSTVNPDKPAVNLDLDISKWDIPVAFQSVNSVQRLAPIAENCSGLLSSRLNFNATLDKNMEPILSSLEGDGNVQTEGTVVENSQTMNRIAATLKNDNFKRLEFGDINMLFRFMNGRVNVLPFDVRLGKSKANISGSHGFDQTLDYKMKMDIPTSEFGGDFNSFLGSVSSQLSSIGLGVDAAKMAEEVRLELLIRGTVSNPKVSIGGLNLIGSGGQALKTQLAEKIRKEAEKIIGEAEKRAGQIRDNARKAADSLRKEGYLQADKLEAGAKGPLAQLAAKGAADKLRGETDKKANQLISEADQRADKLIEEARKKAQDLGG